MARTRKMANLVIEETSGVDHPAHLHEGWLVMKSADESEVQRVLDETLTEEDSIMEETTTAATDAQVEKAEMTIEDAMKKIAELEAKLAESKSEDMAEANMAKSEDASEDFLKSAPESVVKMIEDFKKQAETATEELRKEREAKADADAAASAESVRKQKVQQELTEIFAIIPKIAELTLSLGELTKTIIMKKSVVSGLTKNQPIKVSASELKQIQKLGKTLALKIAESNKGSVNEGAVASFAEGVRILYVK